MANKRLSQLTKVLEHKQGAHYFIGMDVHKKSYHIALRRNDDWVHTFVATANAAHVIQMIQKAQITVKQIVYEAGPTGFTLARALKAAGLPVMVVAPSKVPRSVSRANKTDRLDCIKLADYAAKGMLTGIAIPTEQQEAQRSLIRRRHDLADGIKRVKQRIRSFLLFLGTEQGQSWSQKGIKAMQGVDISDSAKQTLESMLRELKFFAQEKRQVQAHLLQLTQEPEHQQAVNNMKSTPGIGQITAATFRMEIFAPERFKNPDQLASYVGLAPTVTQSGQSKQKGQLVQTGQVRLRSLLIEAAWRWRAKDEQARAFYQKIVSRTGLSQKAIVALARKLLIILWKITIENRPYVIKAAQASC
jgi:transposase